MTPSLIEQEKCNSKFLKEALAHHLMWRLHYSVVVDEFHFMDMFGLRRNGYGVEYEIKVSKSDFDREMRCIHAKEESITKYGKDWEKFIKHRMYLTGKYPKTPYDLRLESLGFSTNQSNIFVPNEFYFYVPDFLADHAIEKTQGLPYGVVKIGATESGNTLPADDPGHYYFWNYTIVKKATKLHTEKVSASIIWDMAHALSMRNRLLN